MEQINPWLEIVGNYGFPIALVVACIYYAVMGIRALWAFIKPNIQDWIDKRNHLTDKQSQFIDAIEANNQHLGDSVKALLDGGQAGHTTTHKKLDEVRVGVKEIRDRLKDSCPPKDHC